MDILVPFLVVVYVATAAAFAEAGVIVMREEPYASAARRRRALWSAVLVVGTALWPLALALWAGWALARRLPWE